MLKDIKGHKDLIQRICKANPGTFDRGFYDALSRRFIETGEGEEINDEAGIDLGHDGPFSVSDVKRLIHSLCDRIIPDAWSLPSDHPMIVVWEVAFSQNPKQAHNKWMDFAYDVLDISGNFSIAAITVTGNGVCCVPFFESFGLPDEKAKPFRDAVDHTCWMVDSPCPIDWKLAIGYSDRWLKRYQITPPKEVA